MTSATGGGGRSPGYKHVSLLFIRCKIPGVLNLMNHSLPIYKMEMMSTSTTALGLDVITYAKEFWTFTAMYESNVISLQQKPKVRKETPPRHMTLSKVTLFIFLTRERQRETVCKDALVMQLWHQVALLERISESFGLFIEQLTWLSKRLPWLTYVFSSIVTLTLGIIFPCNNSPAMPKGPFFKQAQK